MAIRFLARSQGEPDHPGTSQAERDCRTQPQVTRHGLARLVKERKENKLRRLMHGAERSDAEDQDDQPLHRAEVHRFPTHRCVNQEANGQKLRDRSEDDPRTAVSNSRKEIQAPVASVSPTAANVAAQGTRSAIVSAWIGSMFMVCCSPTHSEDVGLAPHSDH